MTVNDAAILNIGSGNYFTAPYIVGTPTPRPADLTVVTNPFTAVGHTSLEEIFNMSSEGGEATTIGTLQNRTLKTKYSDRTDAINFTLQQFDTASLKLFYGSNATISAEGDVQVPTQGTPTVCTFLAVFIDGENYFGIYAPKAEIFRADGINAGDAESLAGLPLQVKPLKHGDNKWAYSVTPLGEVTP